MRTIHKFPVGFMGEAIEGHDIRVVLVGLDPNQDLLPTVWVEYEPDGHEPHESLHLSFIGTGHGVPVDGRHVGSVVMPTGLVWHVYGVWMEPG